MALPNLECLSKPSPLFVRVIIDRTRFNNDGLSTLIDTALVNAADLISAFQYRRVTTAETILLELKLASQYAALSFQYHALYEGSTFAFWHIHDGYVDLCIENIVADSVNVIIPTVATVN